MGNLLVKILVCFFAGGAAGIGTGFAGMSAAAVVGPMLAVGTSVFIMAFTALTGSLSHFAIGGMPDLSALLLCIIFTLIWARIAAVLANKASAKALNQVVGLVMILTSIAILTVKCLG